MKSFTKYIRFFERKPLTGDIVHYKFILKIGPGEFDQIGLHRVVKETRPFRPVRTRDVLFYQHGDAKNFEGMMLPGTLQPHTADDFGMAIYLAQNDVDVWGIDQAWTMVPEGLADYSFMKDWGIEKQADDLNLAIAIARHTRLFTGNGMHKVILAGYSSGVSTTLALVNNETQLQEHRRQVHAYMPIDMTIKTESQEVIEFWEAEYALYTGHMNDGIYHEFVFFALAGELARNDPDGESPLIPGFTNMQAALYFGAANIFGVMDFHYHAGIWEDGLPVDLQFLTIDQFLDFLVTAVPYEPSQFMADYSALIGDVVDVPFDDYLSEISIPILNVAPAGGFGEDTFYGIGFMASTDVTHLITRLRPVGEELFDFAHIDLFTANNAEELVWKPILDWIKAHTPDQSKRIKHKVFD